MSEKEKTQTVELGSDVVDAIAEKMSGVISKQVAEAFEKAKEEQIKEKEKTENVIKKDVGDGGDEKTVNKITFGQSSIEKESVQRRTAKALVALLREDRKTLRAYNEVALKNIRKESGYGNEGTDADGGYLVPDPDFEAEVEKLLDVYGVAAREADVRTIRSNAVKTNKLGSGVSMYDTAEAAAKTGTKMTISQSEATLRKFAAIAPVTDELDEDSAIDFYNELTQGFAQERARIMDELVFTENGTTNAKKGILRVSGTKAEAISGAISTITWDDVLNAWTKLPTAAQANAKLYLHPTIWNILQQVKDDNGRYQWIPQSGVSTPFGLPVILCDKMPKSTDIDSDGSTPYAVVADLKKSTKLYVKRGMVLTILREGTVVDADGSTIYLAKQDMTALRAVTRMVQLHKFPEAACVIGSGSVS